MTTTQTRETRNVERFYPISQFYKQRFGGKVYKISVSVAETCPNRMGVGGMQTCIFCDEWGSAAYHLERDKRLDEQIRINREKIAARYRAERFLVYFQAYTNTFDRVTRLESRFETALQHDDVVGLVLGTRPDCLPSRMFPLLKSLTERTFVSVELGVQSFFDDQLVFMRRGHDAARSIEAVHKLHDQSQVDIGIHLMFGQPGETDEHIIRTAEILNGLPVDNVKLHNLHVLTKTPLEELYRKGEFEPLDLDTYAHRVILFLRHLSPRIAVQRLAAVASRWDELVAPDWTKQKMAPTQFIKDRMAALDVRQGDALDGPHQG